MVKWIPAYEVVVKALLPSARQPEWSLFEVRMCFAHEAVEHLILLFRVRKLLFSRQKSNQKRRLSRVFLSQRGFRAQLSEEHIITLLRAQNGSVVN